MAAEKIQTEKQQDLNEKKEIQMERQCYVNRELSWLKFNERVLEEAEDNRVPLCERLTFASIYQSNLDEFFMVRVGSLHDEMLLGENIRDNKTNLTSQEQITAVLEQVAKLGRKKDRIYDEIMEQLQAYGVRIVDFQRLSEEEGEYLEQYFDQEICPLISPMIVGKRQPFPFLRNQEIYAAVVLETKNGKEKIGIIPCSREVFERLIAIPQNAGSYMLSEELILHFIPKVFKNYRVRSKTLIRLTRNADIDADSLYDEDLNYRDLMAELVKRRKKLSPVRLEISREIDRDIVMTLCGNLGLEPDHVFKSNSPLDLSFVFRIQDDLRKQQELFYEKRIPQKAVCFEEGRSLIAQIKEKDKMLSFPYESIKPFLNLLHEAACDPEVVSIKMTLYRLARQSKVVEALVEAAENGKEVVVLVELRARFDEENNIEWSRRLEDAGCRVIYGLDGYKVHSKLCLITRKSEGQIEYITQIGTGNYNEKTARLYTDIMVMTADVNIGLEASEVFQALSLGEVVESTKYLLVAPKCLQNQILDRIELEIQNAAEGKDCYIGLKLNSLTDKKIIDKLIKASKAGVHIDLVVRGICCLVAGVEGETENIRVFSIVGRFLEHSRIYIFGSKEKGEVYIASADFMTRNTLRRVEVAMPVHDPELRTRISGMFMTMLSDNQKARVQLLDGSYHHKEKADAMLDSQEYFYRQAYEMAGGTE